MLDGQFRSQIETWVKPVGQGIKRTGVPADAITATGVVMAIGCFFAVGNGALNLGLLLLVLTGLPDLIDGAVAKAAGTSTLRGAFFDSVTDRLTDGLLFGGVAWYFINTTHSALPLLPFGVYVSASIVSYIRAKADALGFDARGGLIERAERFILLGLGLLFHVILVPVLFVMLALNLITAGQRFVKVWRQASEPLAPRARRSRRDAARVGETSAADRWRTRRQASVSRPRPPRQRRGPSA